MTPVDGAQGNICAREMSARYSAGHDIHANLLPVPSPPSLAEPENSMVFVSPEIVLARFTNSLPSSCSPKEISKGVPLGGMRHGKLAA